jgi:hypothetical protein
VRTYLGRKARALHCFGLPDEFVPHGSVESEGQAGPAPAGYPREDAPKPWSVAVNPAWTTPLRREHPPGAAPSPSSA